MLHVTQLALPEVLLLEYDPGQDNRARFYRTYSQSHLQAAGIETPLVEEIVYQVFQKNTVYGIHFQNHPQAQTKLLSCTRGRILDFAVDLRKSSPTFRQWVSVELSQDSGRQLLIPPGFGHAALTLEDTSCIVMRIDRCFDPALSRAVQYNDPDIGILQNLRHPILSAQDAAAPPLSQSGCNL